MSLSMSTKSQVTIICGGQSVEHAVSIKSAQFIVRYLDATQFEPSVIIITESGQWHRLASAKQLLANEPLADCDSTQVVPAFGIEAATWLSVDGSQYWHADVVFPIIHGTSGEDGCIQGVLRMLNVPFVGADVYASAACMNKLATKVRLEACGIHTAPWCALTRQEYAQGKYPDQLATLGYPLFVKPAELGSSVGITKVHRADQLAPALEHAFQFCRHVLLEAMVVGREVECAVKGNDVAHAAIPGELVVHTDFYDYTAKYLSDHAADIIIPAQLTDEQHQQVMDTALRAYQIMQCEGLARVDMFVDDAQIIVNEINTLPGFTQISMYPKMWQHQGLDYQALLSELIHFAKQRHQQMQVTHYSFQQLLAGADS